MELKRPYSILDESKKHYKGGAIFSEDRVYRYKLWRPVEQPENNNHLQTNDTLTFIMLNPSVANEDKNDATIRRCLGYAKIWGYNELVVVNLFAMISTEPKDLYSATIDPMGGEENNYHIIDAINNSSLSICAWGNHGIYQNRGNIVKGLILSKFGKYHHLGLNKNGEPKHPLRLSKEVIVHTDKI